jgi:hypothetical protein
MADRLCGKASWAAAATLGATQLRATASARLSATAFERRSIMVMGDPPANETNNHTGFDRRGEACRWEALRIGRALGEMRESSAPLESNG